MTSFKFYSSASFLIFLAGCGPLKDLSDMHDDMKGLRVDIKGMSSQLTDTNQSISSMSGQLTDTNKSITSMAGQLGDTNKSIGAMVGTVVDMDTGLKSMGLDLKGMRTEFTSLHADIKSMLSDIKVMAAQMTTLNKVITNMFLALQSMGKDVEKMSAQMSVMNSNIDRMYDTMAAMAKSVDGMYKEMATLDKNIVEMHDDMGDMVNYIQTMTEQMDTMNSVIGGMFIAIKGMGGDVHALNGKFEVTNRNISEMNGKLGGLVTQISGMRGTLGQMFGAARMGIATLSRQQALTCLDDIRAKDKSTFNGIQEKGTYATAQSRKLACASAFYGSFDYQLWTTAIDKSKTRDDMMRDGVMELFTKIAEYTPDLTDLTVTYTDYRSQSLYALAFALDFVNDIETNTIILGKDKNNKPIYQKDENGQELHVASMLSLLETALADNRLVSQGKLKKSALKEYEVQVLNNQKTAEYLLRLRANFLKAVAICILVKDKAGNDGWVFPDTAFNRWTGLVGVTHEVAWQTLLSHYHLFGSNPKWTTWKKDLSGKNFAQLSLATHVLQLSAHDEKFMIENDISPKVDVYIKDLLGHLSPDFSHVQNVSAAEINAFEKILNTIVALDRAAR